MGIEMAWHTPRDQRGWQYDEDYTQQGKVLQCLATMGLLCKVKSSRGLLTKFRVHRSNSDESRSRRIHNHTSSKTRAPSLEEV